jgi:hypothetical protein
MNLMDHSEALRLQAAEKYVLGELTPELRDQYEEHYFDCQECAGDVKTAVAFVDGTRAILRETGQDAKTQPVSPGGFGLWHWLRPVVTVPLLAALLLMLTYQGVVVIPQLKRQAASAVTPQADFVSLIGANSRGDAPKVLQIHRDRPAILEVDIPAQSEFSGYNCRLLDEAGSVVYSARVSAADARQTVHLIVPGGRLRPARYNLVILGEGSASSAAGDPREVSRLTFTVEFIP